MKRWMGVVVLLLAVVPCARADEASKRAKVQELFVTMHMERTMGQLMEMVMRQTRQMMQGMPGADKMTAQQKTLVDDFQKRAETMVTDELGWKALEPEYVGLYASTYSEEEIDGILAFYKSPIGQAMLDKTPELTTRSGAMVQTKMATLQPKMNAMMEDFMKQLAATMPAPPHKKPASN